MPQGQSNDMSVATRARGKELPPYGASVIQMLSGTRRPALFGGSIVVALDWRLGRRWPRIVLPPDQDPHAFHLAFLSGLSLVIAHRPGHRESHLKAALEAVAAAKPRKLDVIAVWSL